MSGAFPEETRALDAWAGAHVEGWGGPSAVAEFPTGQSNPTYRIENAEIAATSCAASRRASS